MLQGFSAGLDRRKYNSTSMLVLHIYACVYVHRQIHKLTLHKHTVDVMQDIIYDVVKIVWQ